MKLADQEQEGEEKKEPGPQDIEEKKKEESVDNSFEVDDKLIKETGIKLVMQSDMLSPRQAKKSKTRGFEANRGGRRGRRQEGGAGRNEAPTAESESRETNDPDRAVWGRYRTGGRKEGGAAVRDNRNHLQHTQCLCQPPTSRPNQDLLQHLRSVFFVYPLVGRNGTRIFAKGCRTRKTAILKTSTD